MSIPRLLAAAGFALCACLPASAQVTAPATRPERPYRGVFASGMDESGQSLTATGTFSGGYDDNILANAGRNNVRQAQAGGLAQFSGGLAYALTGERGALHSGAGSSMRYYPALQTDYNKSYNASVGGELVLFKKPHVSVHGSANYRPHNFFSLVPGEDEDVVDPLLGASSPPELDFVPVTNQYIAYKAGATLSRQISPRVSFSTSYNYRLADRLEHEFWRHSVGTELQFQLTRGLGLHTGVRYNEAHYGDRIARSYTPNVGFDFNRALSLTRRTTLSFGVGAEANQTKDSSVTRLRATGNATVAHEIGRSWSVTGNYRRGTYYAETLPEPAYGDGGQVSLVGLITRRLQFQAGASASLGSVGYNTHRKYDIYRGSMSLSTALTRFMNVGVDYAYYNYNFDSSIALGAQVPSDIHRQSIRAHLSLWAPLLNRSRSTNATR